ncbi:MAG: HAD family hydrolase [Clostridia bacterium]|nr:HAD family hydrolase [Clostridia bacterium]
MNKKAVVFDFDGTLTKKNQNIWKMLWETCGYPTDKTSLYAQLYVSHVIKKEITRKQWFDLTCEEFMKKNLDCYDFFEVSCNIELINGLEETIKMLYKKGYRLYIVSGCIKESIEIALGEYADYFTFIESNRAYFDMKGKLYKFKPTNYDYEGKAKFIEEIKKSGIKAENITFVGNSDNDEWAYTTGCKTICINPDKTDGNNKTKWHKLIEKLENLKQILPFILNSKDEEKSLY